MNTEKRERELMKEEKVKTCRNSKRKMSDEDYETAKEIVIENIINMQTKDLAGELEWLLNVCYFGSSGNWAYNRWNMVEDWNIDIEDVIEKE